MLLMFDVPAQTHSVEPIISPEREPQTGPLQEKNLSEYKAETLQYGRRNPNLPRSLPSSLSTPTGGTVNMRAPNGQIKPVPASEVEHYRSLGAVVVP